MAWSSPRRLAITLLTAALTALGLAPASPASVGLTDTACTELSAVPVRLLVNPTTQAGLLTHVAEETRPGFTLDKGAILLGGWRETDGLVPVARLRRGDDFAYATGARKAALIDQGYTPASYPEFFAATASDWCTTPVHELVKGGIHRYTVSESDQQDLVQVGWHDNGVVYHVSTRFPSYPPPTAVGPTAVPDPHPNDQVFSFAAIPDTQKETKTDGAPRLRNRSRWLVDSRVRLDLRWAVQVGDLVPWDPPDHRTYRYASQGLAPMRGRLPYFLNIGNHDGQGMCGGRLPYRGCNHTFTSALLRATYTFNDFFTAADYGAPVGAYEPGKVDNTWSTFGAGGRKWLVLNLEIFPRYAVVAWAQRVISSHPHHNVVVTTHAYLSKTGRIPDTKRYGDATPRYLWRHLIRPYANVRMVLCGNTGIAGTRVDHGAHGNKIVTFLQTFHSERSNPTRLIRVDTHRNQVTSWIYGPYTHHVFVPKRTWSMQFVR